MDYEYNENELSLATNTEVEQMTITEYLELVQDEDIQEL